MWDYSNDTYGWCNEMKKLFSQNDMDHIYENISECNLNHVWSVLYSKHCYQWNNDIKLKFYMLYKSVFCIEPYVVNVLNRQGRSILAQLRCGIVPLRIKTGRYACNYISENERFCLFCNRNEVENEVHFLFYCDHYNEIRESFYSEITYKCENFAHLKINRNLIFSCQTNMYMISLNL